MRTSQSLFPTTTKSKATFRKQPTYHVLRKVIDQSDLDTDFQFAPIKSIGQLQQSRTEKIQNIFRDKYNELKHYSIEDSNDRPVGGTYLVKKYQKTSQLVIEDQSKRLSKKSSRRNIKQANEKISMAQFKSQPTLGFLEKDIKLEEVKNQTLKTHHDCKETYTTAPHGKLSVANSMVKCQSFGIPDSFRRCSTAVGKSGRIISIASGRMKQNTKVRTESSGKCSSMQTLKQPSSAEKNHLKWVQQQQHQYLDKMAILNEINYNRPLIEKFGNRYFEEILRNRYMDEPQYKSKSPFIYQIKDKMADTKFISKIKSMKCNFMERSKLVLKGRSKIALEHEDKESRVVEESGDEMKRWEGFAEEMFAER